MTPTDTYNAQVDFAEIQNGVRNNKNLGVTNECLLLYGNGDGGGGSTSLMLEKVSYDLRSIDLWPLTDDRRSVDCRVPLRCLRKSHELEWQLRQSSSTGFARKLSRAARCQYGEGSCTLSCIEA
jgi:hypothetical protein